MATGPFGRSVIGADKKTKAEKPNSDAYTLHYLHTKPETDRQWDGSYYRITSIDPARKNYALRIFDLFANGQVRVLVFYKKSLNQVEERHEAEVLRPTKESTRKTKPKMISGTQTNIQMEVINFLETYREYYFTCHYIIIERQWFAATEVPYLGHLTHGYFATLLRDAPLLPEFVEINPEMKSTMFGVFGLDKNELKRWSIEMALRISRYRNDEISIKLLTKSYLHTKLDDYADTIVQVEAYFRMRNMIEIIDYSGILDPNRQFLKPRYVSAVTGLSTRPQSNPTINPNPSPNLILKLDDDEDDLVFNL